MKYSIAERQKRAEELRSQGYNCAQCVMMVFDDVTGLYESIAARMLAGFGSGMGQAKEVCGTLAAATALRGVLYYKSHADKINVYKANTAFNDAFEERNGSTRCGELKRGGKPCLQLIKYVIEMMALEIEDGKQHN